MTGHPYFTNTGSGDSAGTGIDRDDRLVITTERGELHYAELRKLRGIWILEGDASNRRPHRRAGTRRAGHLGGIPGGAARSARRVDDGVDESAGDRRLGQHAQR
jgi:hypothetical protein